MAIDFPNSPSLNDTFTVGQVTWKWDGSSWKSTSLEEIQYLQGVTSNIQSQIDSKIDKENQTFHPFLMGL